MTLPETLSLEIVYEHHRTIYSVVVNVNERCTKDTRRYYKSELHRRYGKSSLTDIDLAKEDKKKLNLTIISY